ncbi:MULTISPECIES: hypothetical protein [Bacteroidales]|jgi:hypothetical protein|uniref:hypothetical protein n=1 Tax=Bacteroidales TaxID=171549 RepID=UPI001E5F0E1D|nr:hypothetical protein [Phocaeicola massiliensis]
MITRITLEDKGQDLLWLRVNEGGLVEEAGPFQNEIWKGSYVPYWGLHVGQLCPIHNYPHIIQGFLKYKIISIEKEL